MLLAIQHASKPNRVSCEGISRHAFSLSVHVVMMRSHTCIELHADVTTYCNVVGSAESDSERLFTEKSETGQSLASLLEAHIYQYCT
jgi:hypothetical protein